MKSSMYGRLPCTRLYPYEGLEAVPGTHARASCKMAKKRINAHPLACVHPPASKPSSSRLRSDPLADRRLSRYIQSSSHVQELIGRKPANTNTHKHQTGLCLSQTAMYPLGRRLGRCLAQSGACPGTTRARRHHLRNRRPGAVERICPKTSCVRHGHKRHRRSASA